MTCQYPANLRVFTDGGSACHVAWGAFAGILDDPVETIAVLTLFTGYQLSQAQAGEPLSRVGGELVEFGLGLLAARFLL